MMNANTVLRRTPAAALCTIALLLQAMAASAQSAGRLPAGSLSSTYGSPPPLVAAAGLAPPRQWARTLVVVQLQGGNDGLNTIIPYSDPLYYKLRPSLAIPRAKVLPLSPELGLNPVMKPLLADWKKGDMAVVLGVGYPDPNRSHFRSTDIWETGSGSTEVLNTGWLDRMLQAARAPKALVADGAVIGGLGLGPLRGPALRTISMNNPAQFIAASRLIASVNSPAGGSADGASPLPNAPLPQQVVPAAPTPLQFLLTVQHNLVSAARRLDLLKSKEPTIPVTFPKTRFGQEMRNAAELIAMGAAVPVVKVQIGGFDTHAAELVHQDAALQDLAQSLTAFRTAMIKLGKWNDILVMTYSEFGRRVMENGSRGTDHGTSEPVILLGGEVKGGFYGRQPSLSNLTSRVNGDLKYTTDYRSLYMTIGVEWWKLPASAIRAGLFPGVDPSALEVLPVIRGAGGAS